LLSDRHTDEFGVSLQRLTESSSLALDLGRVAIASKAADAMASNALVARSSLSR
jgi:hypothetical protein